jgi:hypothetical protein
MHTFILENLNIEDNSRSSLSQEDEDLLIEIDKLNR